jgi:hypothetical protein
VKRQLVIATVDYDIVEVFCKMPHIFTNAEYADMLYVFGFCDGSATAEVDGGISDNVSYQVNCTNFVA